MTGRKTGALVAGLHFEMGRHPQQITGKRGTFVVMDCTCSSGTQKYCPLENFQDGAETVVAVAQAVEVLIVQRALEFGQLAVGLLERLVRFAGGAVDQFRQPLETQANMFRRRRARNPGCASC